MMKIIRNILSILLMLSTFQGMGHGDLDIRIQEASADIQAAPDEAALYFKRGKLYYQHEEYENAILDFDSAESKGYNLIDLYIFQAKSYIKTNEPRKVLFYADKAISKDSTLFNAYQVKGEAYIQMRAFDKAAIYYEKTISLLMRPRPQHFIDAAIAWQYSDEPDNYARANQIINIGIETLGPLPSLLTAQQEVAVYFEDHEAVLKLMNQTIEQSLRKEVPLYELAKYLIKIDRVNEGQEALRKAMKLIYDLPLKLQQKPNIKELIEDIALLEKN